MSNVKQQLQAAINIAIQLASARLEQTPNYIVYQVVDKQLQMIQTQLETNSKPSAEQKRKVNFDSIAARELELNDKEFTDALNKVGFLYRRW